MMNKKTTVKKHLRLSKTGKTIVRRYNRSIISEKPQRKPIADNSVLIYSNNKSSNIKIVTGKRLYDQIEYYLRTHRDPGFEISFWYINGIFPIEVVEISNWDNELIYDKEWADIPKLRIIAKRNNYTLRAF